MGKPRFRVQNLGLGQKPPYLGWPGSLKVHV